ncbi:uncharacterized protein OCT59_026628 [Rhizophagus irregularis]|uniref:uncharacterized protein n=1 Tax=Rhizophagus irregularis TaxID=588596 RepID=UPI00332F4C6A|nr:hypothetical protein OCT59_026628 [Rhizophagus irregularis]
MEDESNLHLWQCPEAITLLIPTIFNNFAIKLQANADSPACTWQVAIGFCAIFSWTRKPMSEILLNKHLFDFFT